MAVLAYRPPGVCTWQSRQRSAPSMPSISSRCWHATQPVMHHYIASAIALRISSSRVVVCKAQQTTGCQAVPGRRIAIFVEPSPFTYVCGYANRFTNTIRCLVDQGCQVLVITTGMWTYLVKGAARQTFNACAHRQGHHPARHACRCIFRAASRLPWCNSCWCAILWLPPLLGHAHITCPVTPRVYNAEVCPLQLMVTTVL